MPSLFLRFAASIIFIALFSFSPFAQTVQEPSSASHPEWSKAYPPFRIAGNLYYVGTYDLACYLITTNRGNILINTGLASSAAQIKASIKALGFKLADTKLLLTTQAHYDHLGAMAAIKRESGAQLWVNAPDAPVVADGGASDYAFGSGTPTFEPLQPDSLLKDGDTISLGGTKLVLYSHPGHTKGSCSYLLQTKDAKRRYTVLIANLPTIVTEKKFEEVHAYPGIAADYAASLRSLKSLRFDLWVASHASQFGLHKKRKPGDAYHPTVFADKKGFDEVVAELEKEYELHLKKR